MEFKLNKYSNFLSKKKEKIFILKNDEIRIKNKSDENFQYINNIDTYYFTNLSLIKLYENELTISSSRGNIYLSTSQESEINNLPNFVNFFNFSKYVYILYLFYNNFEKDELFKFNIKEYIANLKQYTRNDILIVILNNIKRNEPDMKILIELSKNKFDEIKNILDDSGEFKTLIEDINYDYREFIDIFIQNSKILESIEIIKLESEEMNPIPYKSINNSMIVQNDSINFFDIVQQIEKINELYFSLSRLLIEIKKSIMEINLQNKSDNFSKNDLIRRLVNRLIKKEETELVKNKKNKNSHDENIIKLESKHKEMQSTNQQLKNNLKEFLKDKDHQIYFCFKCGNLLKRSARISSSCNFDSDCKTYSNYTCINCNINFCPICIVEISEEKCGNGHLMFNYIGIINKSCVYCEENLGDEGFSCNMCDLFICEKCYDLRKNIERIKCNYCNIRMVFKTGQHERCLMCLSYKECPWKCFFCNYDMCEACNLNGYEGYEYCGQLHLMKNFSLVHLSYDTNKMNKNYIGVNIIPHTAKIIMNQLNTVKFCSKCGEFIYVEYLYCFRCSYLICQNCHEKKK